LTYNSELKCEKIALEAPLFPTRKDDRIVIPFLDKWHFVRTRQHQIIESLLDLDILLDIPNEMVRHISG